MGVQAVPGLRADIEGVFSFLKRTFGLDRCTWRGEEAFRSYVLSGVVAANLLTLARHLLGRAGVQPRTPRPSSEERGEGG